MRKEELRTYIENHESEMIEDLKSPVSYTHLTLPTT